MDDELILKIQQSSIEHKTKWLNKITLNIFLLN
jgi:hypothetical protein